MNNERIVRGEELENEADFSEERRFFLKQSVAMAGLSFLPVPFVTAAGGGDSSPGNPEPVKVTLTVNGTRHRLAIDVRTTLLDLLREQLALTGTKKGCDFGQCGACTVHVDGQRTLACLSFAIMQQSKKVHTIESLAKNGSLHPLQQAFIKHDGFQCGYCTPGQIMSGVSCIREKKAGSAEEIQEYMSGNLCRCGAYPNIVNAIMEVKNSGSQV
ncbi:(2Fe-2S)-binding protein [Dyadobacter sp. Leaf189]|uniref:(2Fe-2S)-binding protein n=1 Tax=Dyadobacter sp. Leaf189 TaxID=1736295 RepID=UPI0006F1D30C|nr:2Fe-2S iron-sulfur cluster-binding protein [Dyadobacter sp. Leaf189]KQS34065.1 2Fe-2S ferredoxin [Dyadobacter sp. Leaf189]